MKLEDLHENFLDMSEEDRIQFFSKYSHKRFLDLQEIAVQPKISKASSKEKEIKVSLNQMELLKKIGLIKE